MPVEMWHKFMVWFFLFIFFLFVVTLSSGIDIWNKDAKLSLLQRPALQQVEEEFANSQSVVENVQI